MTIGHFLGGIGALIWDKDTGEYLLLRRSQEKDFQSGAWECVTGRVDQGESYTQAVIREVFEEIGVVPQIELLIGTTHFFRGESRPENELLGVIFGCTISDRSHVVHGSEHSEQRWATPAEIESLLPQNHWLIEVIRRAETLRAQLPEALRLDFIRNGFEI